MTSNMISLIGYVIAVAALALMIGGAAAWNNYKSKKNRHSSEGLPAHSGWLRGNGRGGRRGDIITCNPS
ncbi:MAG: hypothetical protein LUD12_00900 [Lachnospiraceae bacterium]|nr:hypothetical protein [Lachnospiraceae bacterium]